MVGMSVVSLHLASRRLIEEAKFELIDPQRAEVWPTKVEQLLALCWTLAREQIHLVVTIEVVLVGAIAELDAFEKLVSNVWIAGGRGQRGEPIEAGE